MMWTRSLPAFSAADTGAAAPSVAAAFELSCRRLDETAARMFRLLPLNPGPDVSTAAVAVLADLPETQAPGVLRSLAQAHLIDGAAGRWQMHDLLHLYARQLSDAHADADGREQARDRLLVYYRRTAEAANDHLRGGLPGTAVPVIFTSRDGALAWLDTERASLVAAVTMAADTGRDQVALRLPLTLATYFDWRRRFGDRRTPGRGSHLPGGRRPARRRSGADQPRRGAAGAIRRDLNLAKVEYTVRAIRYLGSLADGLRAGKDAEGVRAETPAEPDASSRAALDRQDAAGSVVGFGLVGAEAGEAGQGDVEAVGGAGVADDHSGGAGLGMALGQQVAEDGVRERYRPLV